MRRMTSRQATMRALFSLLTTIALYSPPSLSQVKGPTTASPESVGMSSERLKRLDRAMQGYIDRDQVAGVVTLVARRGEVVHFSALGEQDAEHGVAMRPDSIFRIASMTKPITSVALMMLYEEGYFQLRDPISRWLPEFSDMQVATPAPVDQRTASNIELVPAAGPITVQQLLTHTAGLANAYRGLQIPEYQAIMNSVEPGDTMADTVKRLAELPLEFHPGEAWQYGPATDVVGRLVEVMSGQTLDEFFQERIFTPLGMNDTHFFLPLGKLDRFTAQYEPGEDGTIELADAPTADSSFVREPHVYFRGAGGLVSTAGDYFRFHQMMLNGGELDGTRILSRKTIELMTANHTGDYGIWLTGPGYGFGLGYAVVTDLGPSGASRSVGSYAWGGAFGTIFFVDPAEELVAIMMTQIRPYTHLNIREDLTSIVNQAIVD